MVNHLFSDKPKGTQEDREIDQKQWNPIFWGPQVMFVGL